MSSRKYEEYYRENTSKLFPLITKKSFNILIQKGRDDHFDILENHLHKITKESINIAFFNGDLRIRYYIAACLYNKLNKETINLVIDELCAKYKKTTDTWKEDEISSLLIRIVSLSKNKISSKSGKALLNLKNEKINEYIVVPLLS